MTRRHLLSSAFAWKMALPGYRYQFPRDHFDHPDFRTEWWYYTGNLRAGRRLFGYELTFFRQAIRRDMAETSPWAVNDVYLAHFALSDIERKVFHHTERLNRAGPGIAGVSADQRRVWNGNWQVKWDGERQSLSAFAEDYAVRLTLDSAKPPVIHGVGGLSQKMPGEGNASHYVSLTRLITSGEIEVDGTRHEVQGASWMDHEFFSHRLGGELEGWDWLSLQFDDGSELMVYRLRLRGGGASGLSSGTYVDPEGRTRHLSSADIEMEPGRRWSSAATGAAYPIDWKLRVPSMGLSIETRALMDNQELVSTNRFAPSYWEGAIRIGGGKSGVGYLEMTGYDKGVNINGEETR